MIFSISFVSDDIPCHQSGSDGSSMPTADQWERERASSPCDRAAAHTFHRGSGPRVRASWEASGGACLPTGHGRARRSPMCVFLFHYFFLIIFIFLLFGFILHFIFFIFILFIFILFIFFYLN